MKRSGPSPAPRRQGRPRRRRVGGPAPRLDDYGLVGDLRTAALISRAGSVDWWCIPHFSSPSVFGRILDAGKGGFQAITPVEPADGTQSYLPSTSILETRFRLSRGRRLRILDFMPILAPAPAERPSAIIRIAEASGGAIPVRVECEPRFDYGRRQARWSGSSEEGYLAESGPFALRVTCPSELAARDGRIAAEIRVGPSEPLALLLSGGRAPPIEGPVTELLRRTQAYWLGWVHRADAPLHALTARWHPWIERSEITLKLLSEGDSGAFVAAPTTSLPEWPGGTRNWDYRYVWIRDAAFAAEAFLLLSHDTEAVSFLHWVVGRLRHRPSGHPLRVMHPGKGGLTKSERELRHLAGYLGSRPVRVGNRAAGQFQLDIYGELLEAAELLSFVDPQLIRESWSSFSALADEVVERWRQPDRGIWEVRGRPAHFVHSKLMAWVALERCIRLARGFGTTERLSTWRAEADAVREQILTRGWNERHRSFVQAFGRTAIDAANLRIPLVGFLPFDDPRVTATIDRVERELCDGPFVHRYRTPDGIRGPEGAFLPCSFWLVECQARQGRRSRALRGFERLLKVAGPLGLLPEEYAPRRRLPLGNYPQALSHIGLLRAALALGLADLPKEPDEGKLGREGLHRLRRVAKVSEPPDWQD
ncbi:MAG: glycoside hydrolase family 15 protein [Thermoplasmata archaeon]|nr:glycoside hydrolase family 15 protein [Thermoplasmata archaeon]